MTTTFQSVRQAVQLRIWRWLDQRMPAAETQSLRQRNLFVFPTPFGFSFTALTILLYILGTNYQNNLIILLAYLLLVIFIGSIILAFLNLHHTTINAQATADIYAGGTCQIMVSFHRSTGLPQAVYCGWYNQQLVLCQGSAVVLPLTEQRRGHHQIPRLKLQSIYPFGLVRCWSYLRLTCHYWVFPAPVLSAFHAPLSSANLNLPEEWADQRLYQQGDSLRQLDWKRFSRQQQLLVHHYRAVELPQSELWLAPDPRLGQTEAQWSDLAARALAADQQQQPFGLRLPGLQIDIGSGSAHLRQVMQALALC